MTSFQLDNYYHVLHQSRIPLSSVLANRDAALGHRWSETEDAACAELVAQRLAKGEHLLVNEDGSYPVLDRLASFSVSDSDEPWSLELGPTHYPAHLLTNVEHPSWREEKGAEVMADALAVCALLTTADGYAVWGRRAPSIPEGAGQWHVVPAGHPESPQSMEEALLAELEEELDVSEDEVQNSYFTGIVLSLPTRKPELTARLELTLTWEELSERRGRDAWESDLLARHLWKPSIIASLLVDELEHCIPSGHAATFLAAAQDFGDNWSRDTLLKLRSEK